MRFVVTGEWSRNRLLQVIVVLYCVYVGGLWVTNSLLYFEKMSLTPESVMTYYLGDEETFRPARSYQGLLEVSHFHLFAMGMLLLVLTHLVLFIPLSNRVKAWLIVVPFLSGFADEGASWLVRYGEHVVFAWFKIGAFLTLQGSLATLIFLSLWSVFRGTSKNYRSGESPDG